MTCSEAQSKILDVLEGELSSVDCALVEGHLAHCPDCQREAEGIQQMLATLKNQPLTDPGEVYWQNFSKRVWHQLNAEGKGLKVKVPTKGVLKPYLEIWWEFFIPTISSPAFGVSLSVLLVIGTLFLMPPRHKEMPRLDQIAIPSNLTSEAAELILLIAEDPYDVAPDPSFQTTEEAEIEILL